MWRPSGSHSPERGAHEHTPGPLGSLSWFMERVTCDSQPPPIITLAWRICHAANHLRLHASDTVGSSDADDRDDIVQATSAVANADVWTSSAARHQTPDSTTDVDVDPAGRSSFPPGLDQHLLFIAISSGVTACAAPRWCVGRAARPHARGVDGTLRRATSAHRCAVMHTVSTDASVVRSSARTRRQWPRPSGC